MLGHEDTKTLRSTKKKKLRVWDISAQGRDDRTEGSLFMLQALGAGNFFKNTYGLLKQFTALCA